MKNIEIILPYKYKARDYQLPLYRAIQSQGIKRACSVWHRRGGKDKTSINLITSMSQDRVGIYYYFFPTYNQGRKILWDGIDKTGFPFRSHIPKEIITSENSSEMKITLKNGSIIQIIGTDNIDSIVGTNPVGCVFSEYALQNPQAWDFIRPILAENGGWAIFLFTPRGKNHGWDLYKMARNNPDWFCELLTVNDTGAITPEMIDEERRAGMSEEMIQQEFYCSFEASNPGAYYAQEIRLIREQGRICGVPVESNLPVNTYWDLGMDDSTSIWLAQDVGREIHLVGYYESVGVKISVDVAYLKDWIAKRQATWGYWMLPHDGENRSKQTGKSTRDFLRELGFRDTRIAPRPNRKEDGIEAVRQVLGKCWFDATECDKGIEALSQYRKEWNEVNKVFKYAPVHDWACLTGETKVLTRFGIYQIMDLPKTGEVKTLCGWKKYQNPRITKTNARLVEVVFKDGYTVKCTPDHLFLTESGWKYAENLTKGLLIQSSLTPSPNILMDTSIAYGQTKHILQKVVFVFTEMYGKRLLEKFQKVVTSITETVIPQIINYQILSVYQGINTYPTQLKNLTPKKLLIISPTTHDIKHLNGINQKKADYGIAEWLSGQSHGQNGNENQKNVHIVAKLLKCLLDKVMLKNIAPINANLLPVEKVNNLSYKRDVWCLTVPSVGHFCLENGAVVHNSHGADAFQTLAIGHPGNLFLYNTTFTGNNFEIPKEEIEHDDDPLRFGMRRPQPKYNHVSMR